MTGEGTMEVLARAEERPSISLELPEDLSLDQWIVIGRRLCASSQVINWHIGDWWAFGDHRYGERAKAAAEGIFGRDFQTLMNLASVSRAYEPYRRREALSFSHHAELAPIARSDPHKADELLDAAAAEHWSKTELRRKVAEISAANDPEPSPDPAQVQRPSAPRLPPEMRKVYEIAAELGEALENTRPLNRRERYLLDLVYQALNHASMDLRKAPDDFEIIFVEKGRLACEEWYRASRVTVNRWLVETGKARLVEARAEFVKHGRKGVHREPPVPQQHFDEHDPLHRVAEEAADYLRISRFGGWRVSAQDDGAWLVGTVRKTSDELIAMAERQGFDSVATRTALRSRRGEEVEG